MVQEVREAQQVDAGNFESIRELAQQLRVDSIRSSTAAGSGHPTSSMSAADLMAVLLARHLRYDWDRPDLPTNDHLIFSKGHASPLVYAMFKAAGAISDEELLTFRRMGSGLQGHPTPVLPWGGTRPPSSPGWMSPRDRWDRACRSASGGRWLASSSTSCPSTSGCSVATANWPKARSGKPSTKPATTGFPT